MPWEGNTQEQNKHQLALCSLKLKILTGNVEVQGNTRREFYLQNFLTALVLGQVLTVT